MHETFPFERRPPLTRQRYDSEADRFTVVADVAPIAADDLGVFVGPRLVRLVLEAEGGTTTRSFRPPSADRRFADDGRAVLHNGVLEVTVSVRRSGDRTVSVRRSGSSP